MQAQRQAAAVLCCQARCTIYMLSHVRPQYKSKRSLVFCSNILRSIRYLMTICILLSLFTPAASHAAISSSMLLAQAASSQQPLNALN